MSLTNPPISQNQALVFRPEDYPDPHGHNLAIEMAWLEQVIHQRLGDIKAEKSESKLLSPPKLIERDCRFAQYVTAKELNDVERLVLALGMLPFLAPNLLNLLQNSPSIAQKAKLIRSSQQNSLLPTGETALFLLAMEDQAKRLSMLPVFSAEHHFYQESVIETGRVQPGEPETLGVLALTPYFTDLFIHNRELMPRYNENFPADLITTVLSWQDLVLSSATKRKLEELKLYLEHHDKMVAEWGMQKHDVQGCKILFHGNSGTGKTLVATLLGQLIEKQVFRVDLSLVTSKYIGETSNRLRNLFATAENKGWILFFDEGDAILGQRKSTEGDSPSNHYANHDVAYLLQRIESYNGIVVVASNFRTNIDAAFTRRFDHIIKFDNPDIAKMVDLWQRNMPKQVQLDPKIDLAPIFQRFQLSPASLIKALYRACLLTYAKSRKEISQDDLLLCLKDAEMQVKGTTRTFSR